MFSAAIRRTATCGGRSFGATARWAPSLKQQHAEHAAAGVAVEHVADRGAERRLFAGRRGRQFDVGRLGSSSGAVAASNR